MICLEYNNILQEKDLVKEIINPKSQHKLEELSEYLSTDSPLNKVIEKIAANGEAETYEWKSIRNFILYKIKETILTMQNSYPDFRDRPGDTFDSQLENILQSFNSFEDR